MAGPAWKLSYVSLLIQEKLDARLPVKTWSRCSIVLPKFVDKTFVKFTMVDVLLKLK